MASRRKAREAVLKILYLSESHNISVDAAFHEMEEIDREIAGLTNKQDIAELKPFSLGLDEKQKEFAVSLSHKIVDSKSTFTDQLKPVLINWDISRLSRIDRMILWIAMAEMSYMLDIPPNVSINEALELAKRYSSEKSPSFINGVLDTIARNIGVINT